MKSYKLDIVALFAGMILPFAFAPFYLSPIVFLSPALLMHAWFHAAPKIAFRRGFLFGLGFFGVGISWVYISIHNFGQAPISLSVFITALFVCYLSLFIAIQGYCLNKFLPENNLIKLLLVFPCGWVFFEMLRGWLFTGFPWLFLGYSQNNTWLKGYAPIFGVYGVSFLIVFCSAMLFALYRVSKKQFRIIGSSSIFLVFLIGLLLSLLTWTTPSGQPLRITLIQGNIDQDLKWQPKQLAKTLQLYSNYSAKNWQSDLIVWPEAAITLPLNQMTDFLASLDEWSQKKRTTVITGIPIVNPTEAFNSMIAVGNGSGTYHKRHLVPFGEYTPLKFFWGLMLGAFDIPMSNFERGATVQPPLYANHIPIGPYICYEVAYPVEFLTFLPKAQLLLTITDDSWFGHSIAAEQHLQMAQTRALETGRYLLFSSNTGITAAIDAKGNIIKSIPAFQEAELTTLAQPMIGTTPWVRWKMYPMTILLLVTLIIILYKSLHTNTTPT